MKIPSEVQLDVRLGHDCLTLIGMVVASNLYGVLATEMSNHDFIIFTGQPDLITFNAEKVFGRETSDIPVLPGYPDYDGSNEK
jgi:hypothetical protein